MCYVLDENTPNLMLRSAFGYGSLPIQDESGEESGLSYGDIVDNCCTENEPTGSPNIKLE